MLKITLQPKWSTNRSLSGDLLLDGNFECYFLTMPKGNGLPGSAIPEGVFEVLLAPSPKFQRSAELDPWVANYAEQIPHIGPIPNRSNILIHWGNTANDTQGCILVGTQHSDDFIGGSRNAFAKLHARILASDSSTLEMLPLATNRDVVEAATTGEV